MKHEQWCGQTTGPQIWPNRANTDGKKTHNLKKAENDKPVTQKYIHQT